MSGASWLLYSTAIKVSTLVRVCILRVLPSGGECNAPKQQVRIARATFKCRLLRAICKVHGARWIGRLNKVAISHRGPGEGRGFRDGVGCWASGWVAAVRPIRALGCGLCYDIRRGPAHCSTGCATSLSKESLIVLGLSDHINKLHGVFIDTIHRLKKTSSSGTLFLPPNPHY